MKLPALTVLLPLLLTSAPAQDGLPPEAGFLQVVNLISLKSPTYITLGTFAFDDGKPVPTGDSSGMLAIRPSKHTLTVTNEGAKPKEVTTPLEVENGRNLVVICYDEVIEFKDGSKESKLRFSILVETPEKDKARISLVSLLRKPVVEANIGKTKVTLAYRKAQQVDATIDDVVRIGVGGNTVGDIEIIKPLHYIAFLYEEPETGEISLSVVQNEKLEYQAPLPDEDEEDEEKAEKPDATAPAPPAPTKPE